MNRRLGSQLRFWVLLTTALLFVLGGNEAKADIQHQLVRRIVVFPLLADKSLSAAADEAWWQAREELTRSRRFLVASRQFLMKSDVFQARGELEPADAIILGKLLDAHALLTLQVKERRLALNVYDGSNGFLLWQRVVPMHPSLTVADQLPALAKRLIADFVAGIPYQGFTIVDAMLGHSVYSEGESKFAKVDIGIVSSTQVGDLVQWLQITATTVAPLFQGGSKESVFAEGRIKRLDDGIATVEIARSNSLKDLNEFSLVRLPREAERLKNEFAITDQPRTTLTPDIASPEARPMEQVVRERKPLVASLSFISSLAAFLILAF